MDADLAKAKTESAQKVAQANAKIEEILARNTHSERFKVTPQMRHEAEINRLHDGPSVD